MRPDIQKAFNFIIAQLSSLRLTKGDHMFVEAVIKKAGAMITPEEKDKEDKKKEGKPLTQKN